MFNNMKSTTILSFAALIIFILCLAPYAAHAAAKPVGMIIDVQGSPNVVTKGKSHRARITMPLYNGAIVKTGKNEAVTLVNYSRNKEFKVGPDSKVFVGAKEVLYHKGKPCAVAKIGKMPLPKNSKLTSLSLMVEVARPLEKDNPVPDVKIFTDKFKRRKHFNMIWPLSGAKIADRDITFNWTKGNFVGYKLELKDLKTNKTVTGFPIEVDGKSEYSFTGKPPLEYGRTYQLTIMGRGAGKSGPLTTTFHVLPAEEAKLVIGVEGTFNTRVKKNSKDKVAYLLMADFYRDKKMWYHAIKTLQKMAELDPDNPYVFYFLGNLYKKIGSRNTGQTIYDKGKELEQRKM